MFNAIAYAQEAQSLESILSKVYKYVINPAIIALFAVALVIFFWGVIKYLAGAADKEKRQQGQRHMLWGVIGFVIMIGVYGIISIVLRTFGVKNVTINNDKQEVTIPEKLPEVKIPNFKSQ
jgi:hypothetical protein